MKWERIGTIPTTNARILLTLVLAGLTGLIILLSALVSLIVALQTHGAVSLATWTAPEGWFTFLSVWAGIDVVQFGVKRMTQNPETPTALPMVPQPAPPPAHEGGLR